MRDQILTLASKLIEFPTTKDNPEAINDCIGFIADELKNFNIAFFRKNECPSLLISNRVEENQHFKYLLNGHIDVVAGKEELFKPVVKNGKLLGRGSADMKGPLATMIETFKTVANQVEYPLALQIVADEEIGGADGTLHQIETGVTTDFAIVGEKTDLDIGTDAKGLLWLELQTFGKAAHGAHLWKGENAVVTMVENIQAITKAFPIPKEEVWETTCNISVISAGKALNQVPNQCICKLDIRTVPGDSEEKILSKIKKLCHENTKITVISSDPALKMDPTNKDLLKLKSIIKDVGSKEPELLKENGGSDAHHFVDNDMPAVSFGPIGGDLHSKDEWVDVESLVEQAAILEKFLSN